MNQAPTAMSILAPIIAAFRLRTATWIVLRCAKTIISLAITKTACIIGTRDGAACGMFRFGAARRCLAQRRAVESCQFFGGNPHQSRFPKGDPWPVPRSPS
jgi:hypothetical protein